MDIIVLKQSYKEKKIDEIKQIYDKNNLADIITKALSYLVLKKIISINKIIIRLEG